MDQTPASNLSYVAPDQRERMRGETLLLCSMLFVGALFVADVTTAKLLSYAIFGHTFFITGGMTAFAFTFVATDVICEITGGRGFANKMLLIGLTLRLISYGYYHLIIGDLDGKVLFFGLPEIWTPERQQHLAFVLGGSGHAALAGICATTTSFLIDTFIFNKLRARLIDRSLYWFRNGVATMIAQIVNSLIFVTLAFGGALTLEQIAMTVTGQIVLKILFAWLDTPLALVLRNYGQGRTYWYAFWKRDFYVG